MIDVLVLGGGIHGLCAAFALRRRGREVVVVERFDACHTRGASHGAARITRSSYRDRKYVELARRVQSEHWPLLADELGETLVHHTPGLFFGPSDGPFGEFMAATLAAGVDVEQIDRERAVRDFPLLRIEDGDAVLLDRTAGVLAAARTIRGLRRWLAAHEAELRHGVVATALRPTATAIEVATGEATLRARAVVVATGAWLGELVPEWRSRITTVRQRIGYVAIAAPTGDTQVGRFPVWARIGRAADEFIYGLPDFEDSGLKIARHITTGAADDPDFEAEAIDPDAVLALASRRFVPAVERVVATEPCLYAVTPDEELVVGRSLADPRIIAVAACSGHGFKFGPLIGERIADLIGTR